jgi:hypothetical protein
LIETGKSQEIDKNAKLKAKPILTGENKKNVILLNLM